MNVINNMSNFDSKLLPEDFSTHRVQTKNSLSELIWQTLLAENVVARKLKVLEAQLRSRPNAMFYDLSSGGKFERLLFHPFALHFLKENLF